MHAQRSQPIEAQGSSVLSFRVSALLLCAAVSVVQAEPPPALDAITENSAAGWGAAADDATASLHDDFARVQVGTASLRLETDAPFDCRIWYPAARDADWDLLTAGGPSFRVYAENTNDGGFQNNSPWIRLGSSESDYVDYRTDYDPLNTAIGQWIHVRVPLAGNATWHRTVTGAPDLTSVKFIEIHADTWGAGFNVWWDGLEFTTPLAPPQGQSAVAINHAVDLTWQAYDDVTGQFDHYAVYRATEHFSSVTGMTPIATLSNLTTTTYSDTTAINGTHYYYAVTAVFTGGGETAQVDAIGPRTPRDETDLQVASIARTPRFPRYNPQYTDYEVTEPSGFGPYQFSAATGLGGGQDATTQRFPALGDPVTYTATVRNRGTNPWSGTLAAEWRVDGALVASPSEFVSLAPGATIAFQVVRAWDGASHEIRFTIDVADARGQNNTLARDANSVAFLSYVDISRMESFREETLAYPAAATDDFIDWLNRHMQRFNQMFADAGCAKRVHFDVLDVLPDSQPDPGIDTLPFAIFPFRYRASEGTLRLSGYYDSSEDIDFGLLHEMGHQLGLIDLYRLNTDAGQNLVSGTPYSAPACLMNGCSHFLSQHSANAMNHWLDEAHGYYGQYLYEMPAEVRLRFLGSDGLPLIGAMVTVYQKAQRPGLDEVVTQQPKAQGTTSVAGEYTLPNVPLDPALVPPAFNGDQLHDNPFGYAAVVGTNGLLLFKIEYDGLVDFAWLDITEVNNSFWMGQTQVAVFERSTGLGGPVQHVPPADMAELNANDWSAWAAGSDPLHTYIVDDSARTITGQGSVKFITDGGFDTYVRYPRTFNAKWDLSCAQVLRISAYAENQTIGFQSGSLWVRLLDGQNNYIEYQYYVEGAPSDLLNDARDQWQHYEIPVDAPRDQQNGWRRTDVGSPDPTQIRYLEIHADTWGAGFTLWYDGVGFDRPAPSVADFDHSCSVDQTDLKQFIACATGPGVVYLPGEVLAGCNLAIGAEGLSPADFDSDRDVDMADFAVLQREWTGTTP